MFAEVLDVDQTRSGIIEYFTYSDKISYESHKALLSDYNYSWLSKAWDGLSGFVSGGNWDADYYVLYTDSDDGYIGQGGQTDAEDPDSVIEGEVVQPILSGLQEFWDSLTGNSFMKVLMIILGLVVVVVIVNLLIKLYRLLFPSKRR